MFPYRTPLLITILLWASAGQWLAAVAQSAGAGSGWKLCWSDEFGGNRVDPTRWRFDLGNVEGWGNKELEYCTSRAENVYVKDGMLHIRAMRESFEGYQFTS